MEATSNQRDAIQELSERLEHSSLKIRDQPLGFVISAIPVELAQDSIKEELVCVLTLIWHEGPGTGESSPRLELCQQDIQLK